MPTAQHGSEPALPGPKNNRQNVRKKRTAVSCDRCKNRKTKCVDPVPGPCHYCASINAPCKTDLNRRKKRPYYHVSEEEYRCMTEILRHYLPDLEFNLPALKALCARLDGLNGGGPTPATGQDDEGNSDSHQGDTPSTPAGQDAACSPQWGDCCKEDGADEDEGSNSGIQEIQALQEQLGCLMIDSRGNYRHVGTDSSIGFNAAIRMIKTEPQPDDSDNNNPRKPTQPIIIQPLSTTSLPPATPESSIGVNPGGSDACSGTACHHQPIYLPPLEHASACVQRYFDEVHCLYWLFSTEQFHERVHETYLTGGVLASASWLCCLYCVYAIGSAGGGGAAHGQKTSTEYLVMAKALVPQVVDEADVDSVRALSLLALALQIECYTNAAYLYIGTAVRTAYSLGMHVEKAAPPSRGRLEREQNRRIWWTLYLLDYEIAHRYGNPCAVVEEVHDIQVQMPSEQILSPGPNTPPNYLAAASSLCTISRRIRSTLHQHRQNNPSSCSSSTSASTSAPSSSSNPTISTSTIRTLLAALTTWHASLPAHLSALSHTAPAHRRAVGILHLQYWANVVLVTRPFLLYRALLRKWRGKREEQQRSNSSSGQTAAAAAYGRTPSTAGLGRHDGDGVEEKGEKKCCGGATTSKRRLFAEMADTCTAAARSGLDIMMTMMVGGGGAGGETAAGSLSSLVNFDCSNLLELVQVFRLAMLLEEREAADGSDQSSPFSEMPPCDYCSGGGAGVSMPHQQQQPDGQMSSTSAAAENDWKQRIHEALAIMRAMEPVGWTARALPELEVQMRECGILVDGDECDGGGGVEFMAPPLGMEEMMREAMVGQRDAGGSGVNVGGGYGGVDRMDVEDTLGAFFGDVLGDGAAGGGFGAFGDTYNNVLFLDVDFT